MVKNKGKNKGKKGNHRKNKKSSHTNYHPNHENNHENDNESDNENSNEINNELSANAMIEQQERHASELTEPTRMELRFGVGERVECFCDGWMPGTVVRQFYSHTHPSLAPHPSLAGGKVVPYQIELDTGTLVYAPADDDRCIRAELPIACLHRAQARVATELPRLGHAPPLFEATRLNRVYKDYLAKVEAFMKCLSAQEAKALPWDAFHLEVALLLLGFKPSILICYGLEPLFSAVLASRVFQPWLDSMPGEPILLLRQIERGCEPSRGCQFRGEWVLYAAAHPQRVEVED